MGRKLFNVYGATETSSIASECDHHSGLHLYEDLVIVEAVDSDNEPVPAAVSADKLLVTVLFSRTMPLIRYEMSDSIILAGSVCPCAMPYKLIETIQGRVEEVMHLPNKGGEQVAVQPIVYHRVMETVPAAEWQIVQTDGGLEVLIAGAREGFSTEVLAGELQRELGMQDVATLSVKVVQVETIPRSAIGKAPLIRAKKRA